MVESQVDFKWEGKLPEVLSNTELRCHLYFFQGQSGRSVENGLRRVNMGMGREDWLCNHKQEEIRRGWRRAVCTKIRGRIRAAQTLVLHGALIVVVVVFMAPLSQKKYPTVLLIR